MLNKLIYAEGAPLALPGAISFTAGEIRNAHDRVTPICEGDGTVHSLEISPDASANDICAVLASCGILVTGIVGVQELDQLSVPLRYNLKSAPEIGEGVISLEL